MADVHLPAESQRRLIRIARQTLEEVISRGSYQNVDTSDPDLENVTYGVFVTLFNQDELRGCIGTCTPATSLRDCVIEMTEAAATRDRRVKPVRADELAQIHIYVSVLSSLARVDDPLSLEIGKHGLHVTNGRKRGVLLPQVAVEYGWDIKTFLEQTCAKANLPKDAWCWPETIVSSFTALIIEEEK
jgi:AmmeMemoRadiSam system protein A